MDSKINGITVDTFAQITGGSLETSSWHPTKALESSERQTAADALGADKRVLKCRKEVLNTKHPAWRKVESIKREALNWWKYVSVQYIYEGVRLIRRDDLQMIRDTVVQYQARLDEAVKELDDALPALKEEAKANLGPCYREQYYPVSFRSLFTLEFRERPIDPRTPSFLAHSNSEEYKREIERTLGDISSALKRFESQMWNKLSELTMTLSQKLQPNAKAYALKDNLDAFERLFNSASQWNFDGTSALRRVIRKAEAVVGGIDSEDLRSDKGLRADVCKDMERLATEINDLSDLYQPQEDGE